LKEADLNKDGIIEVCAKESIRFFLFLFSFENFSLKNGVKH